MRKVYVVHGIAKQVMAFGDIEDARYVAESVFGTLPEYEEADHISEVPFVPSDAPMDKSIPVRSGGSDVRF
ncbi:MAG: hypothetical protein DBY20_03690 [Coriobacteriia bacterium]|nr:MAG: hypothetical protein DBY20_03690 [Coriobacteriia bacterium]